MSHYRVKCFVCRRVIRQCRCMAKNKLESFEQCEKCTKLLTEADADFAAWVETFPAQHWARHDLSAARLGWEAAKEFIVQGILDGRVTLT